jgi:hypothetical protein
LLLQNKELLKVIEEFLENILISLPSFSTQ